MPEEHNRTLTDHLSDILLVHSDEAIVNLSREGIDPASVHLVGNTMIDSLLDYLEPARAGKPWAAFGVEPGTYGLVTLHRPALVDAHDRLEAVVDGLIALTASFPVVFPVHPRTRARLEAGGGDRRLREAGVHVSPPLGYLDFLGLEAEAAFVATDSGGVQEETTFLGVRCFTLRDSNERLVTEELGTNMRLGARPERLAEIPALLTRPKPGDSIPGWDGAAGARSAEVLRRALG